MTGGIVVGGWEFVWAAYGLTAAAFLIYGISLVMRLREAKRNVHEPN
jgi:heme exporter protein D